MLLSVVPDVAGPGLLVAFGVAAVMLLVLIVVVEALILWWLHWAGFWRSLVAALVANFASGVVGLILLVFQVDSAVFFLAISFFLSVAIEAGVLMLFKRNATRENWRASLIVNIASYLLIALSYVWLA